MAENSKPVVEITIPGQGAEKKEEKTSTISGVMNANLQEMPSVTRLLNRKKLTTAAAAATDAAALASAAQASAPAAAESAIQVAMVQSVEIAAPTPAAEAAVEVAAPNISAGDAAGGMSLDLGPGVVSAGAESEPLPSVVAPSRRRGTSVIAVAGEAAVQPPIFSKTLMIEKLDLKGLQKWLGRHKKSSNMKKLDILGYLSSYFSEMAYFETAEAGAMNGVLGFGNPHLVVHIRSKQISPEALPSIFELASAGEIFAGPVESLRTEDHAGIGALGFTQMAFVGAIPILYKKAVTGLWICGGGAAHELSPKELTALKKLFSNFAL